MLLGSGGSPNRHKGQSGSDRLRSIASTALARLVLLTRRAQTNLDPLSDRCLCFNPQRVFFHEPSSPPGKSLSSLCSKTDARTTKADGPRSKSGQSPVKEEAKKHSTERPAVDDKRRRFFANLILGPGCRTVAAKRFPTRDSCPTGHSFGVRRDRDPNSRPTLAALTGATRVSQA